jgi:hypothetical protein
MDPRHTLYRTFDKLTVDPEHAKAMSARTDAEAASVQASSGVTPESIEKKLREGLGAVHVEIADLSGMLVFSHSRILVAYCVVMDFVVLYTFKSSSSLNTPQLRK